MQVFRRQNFRTGQNPFPVSPAHGQNDASAKVQALTLVHDVETVSSSSRAAKNPKAQKQSGANSTPVISGLAFLSLLLFACLPLHASVSFSADRISKAAEQYLRKSLGPQSEIESIGTVADQHFTQESVVARISTGADRRSSVRNVLVEFVHEDLVLRQLMLPFRVKQFILIPAAARPLQQGHILQRRDIILKRQEAHAVSAEQPKIEDLLGRKLNTSVRGGQILNVKSSLAANGIIRGQEVILIVRRGSIEVRTQARALADAAPGESIRVIRSGSREPITAIAKADGTVELSY